MRFFIVLVNNSSIDEKGVKKYLSRFFSFWVLSLFGRFFFMIENLKEGIR